MKRLIVPLVVLAALLTLPTPLNDTVSAQSAGCTAIGRPLIPMTGSLDTITVSSTAIGMTTTKVTPVDGLTTAIMAVCTIETNAVRYRDDGTNPTAGVGIPIPAGGGVVFCSRASLLAVRFIRQTSDATATCALYRGE